MVTPRPCGKESVSISMYVLPIQKKREARIHSALRYSFFSAPAWRPPPHTSRHANVGRGWVDLQRPAFFGVNGSCQSAGSCTKRTRVVSMLSPTKQRKSTRARTSELLQADSLIQSTASPLLLNRELKVFAILLRDAQSCLHRDFCHSAVEREPQRRASRRPPQTKARGVLTQVAPQRSTAA